MCVQKFSEKNTCNCYAPTRVDKLPFVCLDVRFRCEVWISTIYGTVGFRIHSRAPRKILQVPSQQYIRPPVQSLMLGEKLSNWTHGAPWEPSQFHNENPWGSRRQISPWHSDSTLGPTHFHISLLEEHTRTFPTNWLPSQNCHVVYSWHTLAQPKWNASTRKIWCSYHTRQILESSETISTIVLAILMNSANTWISNYRSIHSSTVRSISGKRMKKVIGVC